jgi:fatty-acyl-CoA synthase/long-chain acyl-CoA synthetase
MDRKIEPTDRVALLFNNFSWLDNAVCYFAILKAGAVAVPLSFRWTGAEIGHVLEHSGARALLVQKDYLDVAERGRSSSVEWIETDIGAVEAAHSTDSIQLDRSNEDLADIIYTSGTTGLPKGVASPHGNVAPDDSQGFMIGETFIHAIPLGTFAGTHAMMVMPLSNQWTNCVLPKFDAERYCAFAAEQRPAGSYLVPSMAKLIVDSGAPARHDMSSLSMIMFGSSPMPPDTLRRLHEAIPSAVLINLYGLTEGGTAGTSMTYDPERPTAAGRPIGATRIRIVDEEGNECPLGQEGEIWIGLPPGRLRRSYYRDAEAAASVFVDDWVRTGDIGYLDEEGYLYVVDRAKDIVIRGGYNISSAEVEGVLDAHPAVLECAVIGVPHDVLGEDVAAVVVLRPGFKATPDELQAYCRERLADYKTPRRIEFVDELPRNSFLKVLKRELRERLAAK